MGIRNRGFGVAARADSLLGFPKEVGWSFGPGDSGVMSERVHVVLQRRIALQEHVPRSPPGRRARMSEEIGARSPIDGTALPAERLFPRKPIIDNYLSCKHTASRSC